MDAPGKMIPVAAVLSVLFLFGGQVAGAPNTKVLSVLCNSRAYTAGDPFATSLAYVLSELQAAVPESKAHEYRNISPYPNAFAYGHAACAAGLSTAADCSACLAAAAEKMLGTCSRRVGARCSLADWKPRNRDSKNAFHKNPPSHAIPIPQQALLLQISRFPDSSSQIAAAAATAEATLIASTTARLHVPFAFLPRPTLDKPRLRSPRARSPEPPPPPMVAPPLCSRRATSTSSGCITRSLCMDPASSKIDAHLSTVALSSPPTLLPRFRRPLAHPEKATAAPIAALGPRRRLRSGETGCDG